MIGGILDHFRSLLTSLTGSAQVLSGLAVVLAGFVFTPLPHTEAMAGEGMQPPTSRLHTNKAYIENVTRQTVPDQFQPSSISNRIVIGTRSGFAFYNDQYRPRKIFISVHESNGNINNYLDGPFDQLPDNFIKGDDLKNAILDVHPELEGRIARFGNKPDRQTRHMISPYLYFGPEDDLAMFAACAETPGLSLNRYYACFSAEGKTKFEDAKE